MANNIIKRAWNQNRMVNIEDLSGAAFQAENGGHTFEIHGIDDAGDTVALSGTVAGVFRRPDNADIALTGTASDGVVFITLTEDCYAVSGRFGLYIYTTADSKKTCVYAAVGSVVSTSGGAVAGDTPQDVVDLINAIEAAVATIPADYTDLMAAIAPTYSNSALYAVGAYAWYDGKLYRCTTAITTAETWTAAHWTVAVLGDDVGELKSDFGLEKETVLDDYYTLVNYKSADVVKTVGDIADATIGSVIVLGSTNWCEVFTATVKEFSAFRCSIRVTRPKYHIVFTDENDIVLSRLLLGTGTTTTISDYVFWSPKGANKLYICTHSLSDINTTDITKLGYYIANIVSTNASIDTVATGLAGARFTTPAQLNMFEKKIFDGELGFAPQGLAVYGNKAYVVNGFTEPRNVISEINLIDGTFVNHTISGFSTYGGNCMTIDYAKNILFVAEHNSPSKVYAIALNDFSVIGSYYKTATDDSVIDTWNIAYCPIDNVFYTALFDTENSQLIVYKLDTNFHEISHITAYLTNDNFPLHGPGTGQGFGYDGTYFYYMRSDVESGATNNQSYVFVIDKCGNVTKRYHACENEIEDISYDFSTGRTYTSYAFGNTGYITRYELDSGWMPLIDFLSGSYLDRETPENIDADLTTAKIRIWNGEICYKGVLKVNSLASGMTNVITYVSGRVAPVNDTTKILQVNQNSTDINGAEKVIANMSFTNQYVNLYYNNYVPILCNSIGYIFLDGVTLPLGRE